MAQPKRKSPEKASPRKRPTPSRARRMLGATGTVLARRPRLLGGVALFGIVFSFVAANALWYQPGHHPAPMLATRMFDKGAETRALAEGAELPADEPGVTTFRIERQAEPTETAPAEKPIADNASSLVQKIQAALTTRGLYEGPADGVVGPKTTSAILFFEETEGIAPTGEPTEALLARLQARPSATAVAVKVEDRPSMDTTASTRASEFDDVAALIEAAPINVVPEPKPVSPVLVMKIQRALAGLAYENVKVDGIAGEATRAAIRAFEKSYRLPVTGEPSDRVLAKLKAIGAV